MKIVLLGPPGAGKGTQAAELVLAFGVKHLSTGELFRNAMREKSPLGLKALEAINRGELAPDEVVIQLVTENLQRFKGGRGWLLDGFPRTLGQAAALEDHLQGNNDRLNGVILLSVDFERIVNRLKDRRVCRDCGRTYHLAFHPSTVSGECDYCGGELYQRDDDRTETIRKRLQIYEKETAPIVEFYEERKLLTRIDGDQKMDVVSADIQQAVRSLL